MVISDSTLQHQVKPVPSNLLWPTSYLWTHDVLISILNTFKSIPPWDKKNISLNYYIPLFNHCLINSFFPSQSHFLNELSTFTVSNVSPSIFFTHCRYPETLPPHLSHSCQVTNGLYVKNLCCIFSLPFHFWAWLLSSIWQYYSFFCFEWLFYPPNHTPLFYFLSLLKQLPSS